MSKKNFIPYNGMDDSIDGLQIRLSFDGQTYGYVWEKGGAGKGTPMPAKKIGQYLLGNNTVDVRFNYRGKQMKNSSALTADWTKFQENTEVWVNFYENKTVNISLDGKSVQAMSSLEYEDKDKPDPRCSATSPKTRPIVPFNGSGDPMTALHIKQVYPDGTTKGFFWESPITAGTAGPAKDVTANCSRFKVVVSIGGSDDLPLLYTNQDHLDVDLTKHDGTIWVNFYSGNMTVNVSLDGKEPHAVSKLIPM